MKSPEELLLNTSLYEEVKLTSEDHEDLYHFKFFNGSVDYYCSECGKTSTFTSETTHTNSKESYEELTSIQFHDEELHDILFSEEYIINMKCTRNQSHKSLFIFRVKEDKIEKIGQYPSIASLNTEDLKKYRKILSREKYEEFNRAIGLFSHGIGVGSFVYLRRIFESLIQDAKEVASTKESWNEEKVKEFNELRMDEKIKSLKDYLPVIMVNNKEFYSILSAGIHALSEEKCKEHFIFLKTGIELILDEKIEIQEKAKKIKAFENGMSKVNGDVKREAKK